MRRNGGDTCPPERVRHPRGAKNHRHGEGVEGMAAVTKKIPGTEETEDNGGCCDGRIWQRFN